MTRRHCCCHWFADQFADYTDCTSTPTTEDFTDSYNYPLDLFGNIVEAEFQGWMAATGREGELVNYDLRLEWASLNGWSLFYGVNDSCFKPNHPGFSNRSFWSSDALFATDFDALILYLTATDPEIRYLCKPYAGRFDMIDDHEHTTDSDPRYHTEFTVGRTNRFYNTCAAIESWFAANYPKVEVVYKEVTRDWTVSGWTYSMGGPATAAGISTDAGNSIMMCKLPVSQDDEEDMPAMPYTIDVDFATDCDDQEELIWIEDEEEEGGGHYEPKDHWATDENEVHLRVYYEDSQYLDIKLGSSFGEASVYPVPETGALVTNLDAVGYLVINQLVQLRVCVHKDCVMFSVNAGDHWTPILHGVVVQPVAENGWGFGTGTVTMYGAGTAVVSVADVRLSRGNEIVQCTQCLDCVGYCQYAKWGAIPPFFKTVASGITDTYNPPTVQWDAPFWGECCNGTRYPKFIALTPYGCQFVNYRCSCNVQVMLGFTQGEEEPDNYWCEVGITPGLCQITDIPGNGILYHHDFGPDAPDYVNMIDQEIEWVSDGGVLVSDHSPVLLSAAASDKGVKPTLPAIYPNLGYASCQMDWYGSDCLQHELAFLVTIRFDSYDPPDCWEDPDCAFHDYPPGSTVTGLAVYYVNQQDACGVFIGGNMSVTCGRHTLSAGGYGVTGTMETDTAYAGGTMQGTGVDTMVGCEVTATITVTPQKYP